MQNEIWHWFDDDFKVYCANNIDYRKILTWEGSRPGGIYIYPNGTVRHDVVIPRRLVNRAAKLLGLRMRVATPASTKTALVNRWGTIDLKYGKPR